MNYERVLSFGNMFQLNIWCDVKKLQEEISRFDFARYNPNKDVNRYGLSVTSLDGELNGPDLDTLRFTDYNEMSFCTLTDVYHESEELQKLVDPFKPWLGRTHFLNLKTGGYFPPHRDEVSEKQFSFRVIVPIHHMNPPSNYFIHDNNILNWNEGFAYFLNTNAVHSVFSYSDESLMLVMNIKCCDESFKTMLSNVHDL